MKSQAEMECCSSSVGEGDAMLDNTAAIAERCRVDLPSARTTPAVQIDVPGEADLPRADDPALGAT